MKKFLLFSLVLLNSSAFGMFSDPEGCPNDSISNSLNSLDQELDCFVDHLQKTISLLIKINFFENNPQIAHKVVSGGINKEFELIRTMRPHEALFPVAKFLALSETPLPVVASAIALQAEEKKKHPERNYSDEALSDIHMLFQEEPVK